MTHEGVHPPSKGYIYIPSLDTLRSISRFPEHLGKDSPHSRKKLEYQKSSRETKTKPNNRFLSCYQPYRLLTVSHHHSKTLHPYNRSQGRMQQNGQILLNLSTSFPVQTCQELWSYVIPCNCLPTASQQNCVACRWQHKDPDPTGSRYHSYQTSRLWPKTRRQMLW